MTLSPRKTAFATVAALMLAAPAAFAQAQTAPPAEPAPAAAPAPAPQGNAMSWADVDTNQDGNVGKDESAAVPALTQVFDQADADADGQLTPQEYQAFVAKAQAGATAPAPTGAEADVDAEAATDGGE